MSVNSIQNTAGFDSSLYNSLIQTAKAKNVDTSTVDAALLKAIGSGKDFTAAVAQVKADMPTLPQPLTTTSTSLGEWVGMPSPAALIASVIMDEASQQRVQNRSIIQSQGQQIVALMEEQADKIELGATQKFACALTGALVNMAAGAASIGIGARGIATGADGQLTAAKAQAVNTLITSVGTAISSGGDFGQGLQQAEVKRLEARQESIRTVQELTKQTNDAMRDLISKSLDFMSSMQSNMNQTKAKILG